jgi:hypothetical protein
LADAFGWTRDGGIDRATMLGAALGMAGPVMLAAALGRPEAGLAAAVGSLMASGGRDGNMPGAAATPRPSRATRLAVGLGPALAAPVAAALLAGHGWASDAAVTLVAGLAALAGGYSRAAAVATTRFILFLMIGVAVAETTPERGGLAVLMLAGALWTVLVTRALRALAPKQRPAAPIVVARPAPTAAQKARRLRRSLGNWAGWQFTLRLVSCLAVADALKALWPAHHLHWIALTVALLSERQIQAAPVRTTQRALGTLLGVAATLALADCQPPAWALAAGIFVLAGLRPRLRAGNYLAYSAVMTPLVIVLLDRGAAPGVGVLADRLVATLIGAALVIGAGIAARRTIAPDARSS